MSETELPKITLKGGTGYDAPWLTVPFTNPDQAVEALKSIRESGLLEAVVETSNLFHGVNNAGPVLSNAPEQQQSQGNVAQGPWGQPPVQPQQQSRPSAPQGGGASQHPEGKACEQCGQGLEYKKTGSGKGVFRCPQWRWNSGNPNNHTQEWA